MSRGRKVTRPVRAHSYMGRASTAVLTNTPPVSMASNQVASAKLAKLEAEATELRAMMKARRLSPVTAQAALDAIERERAESVARTTGRTGSGPGCRRARYTSEYHTRRQVPCSSTSTDFRRGAGAVCKVHEEQP